MTITLDKLSDLTLEAAWQIGFENSDIKLSDNAKRNIQDGREGFERLLASDNSGFVYGSTAAPGARAITGLTQDGRESLTKSQNLWAPNTFGSGNKWIPQHAMRLILLARVAGYIEGNGVIRLETAKWVANLLTKSIPKIPLDSSTGPGEVMPLSWLYPSLSEIDLASGEIMSLFNGSPCATGLVTDASLTSERRLRIAERIFTLAIEAVAAPLEAYDSKLEDIVSDPFHKSILRQLNDYLEGVPQSERLSHQAPVSWRIIPSVLATAGRAVHDAKEIALRSLQSVSHNPVYLTPDSDYPDGRAISTGGFHNHQASRAIDILNMAGADLCALATKQTSRLLDGKPFGLPTLLVEEGSNIIGTEFLAWSQTSHAERARLAAAPAILSIGLEDPGGGQSDVAAPVFLAYERYLDVADALDAALATLGITIVQAFRLSGRLPPPQLAEFFEKIDDSVPSINLENIGQLGASLRNLKTCFSDATIGLGKFA